MNGHYTTEERLAWWRNASLMWILAVLVGIGINLSDMVGVLKQILAALEAQP